MNHSRLFPLLVFSALCHQGAHTQVHVPDFLSHVTGFSSGRTNHIPRGVNLLFTDSISRLIGNTCVGGASKDDLEAAGIDSLDQRLSRLVNAQALALNGGTYRLPCPVIVGEKRELMSRITRERAIEILPRLEPIIRRLEQALRDRPLFLFHIIWSRVIDGTFWMLWEQEFPNDLGPPATTWLIYPDHPYQVGTVYNSAPRHSEIAITWSFNCSDHLTPIMKGRFDLASFATGGRISDSLTAGLQRFGCLDENKISHIFYYQRADSLDDLFQDLKREFVVALHGLYDYRSLSRTFDIPFDDLYVILVHETAYSIFERLDESGRLTFPPVLKNGNVKQECSRLTSIVMGSSVTNQDILLGAAGVVLVGGLLWLILR